MTLAHLSLTNFRTYKKFSQDLAKTTIVVGPNGLGKTNLLEAIYLLAVLKSYRAGSDSEVVRFGEEFAKIVGEIRISDEKLANNDELEVVIGKGQKTAKKNGAAKPLSQLIGTLKVVLFSPEQLEVVVGPPRRRRRFLDSLLAQVDPRYTQNLLEYQKSLRNRNALLTAVKQGGSSATELYFWDKRLIEAGTAIAKRRHRLVDFFNARLADHYRSLAGPADPLTIAPRFQIPSHELFQASLRLDIQLGATTVGPHRDNFTLQLGSRDLASFGSRGEWRSALFALKATEVDFVVEETGVQPVLLLDDVFSELDHGRRERLFAHRRVGQTMLTTTELAHVDPAFRRDAQILEVADYATAAT